MQSAEGGRETRTEAEKSEQGQIEDDFSNMII